MSLIAGLIESSLPQTNAILDEHFSKENRFHQSLSLISVLILHIAKKSVDMLALKTAKLTRRRSSNSTTATFLSYKLSLTLLVKLLHLLHGTLKWWQKIQRNESKIG